MLNEYICVPGNGAVLRMQQLQASHNTITVFTCSDSMSYTVLGDHTHSMNWFSTPSNVWTRILEDIQPDRLDWSEGDHTSGYANYLYADGHVDVIPAAQVKQWADSDENFAKPPL